MSSEVIVELKDIRLSFDEQRVLDGFSLALQEKETVGLTGPSGSGKSTVLRVIVDLMSPDSGEVLVNGLNTAEWDPRELRRKVVMVPQEASMFPGTVRDNLLWGLQIHGLTASDDELAEVLQEVNLDGKLLDKIAANLSGGEKQRVAIARALLLKPIALLLDEPTSALDEKSTLAVEETVNSIIQDRGIGVLIVTHNRAQAERFTSRVVEIGVDN
ncbi:MAG: ATP-binding cassette domain-containing protein [Candidatus Thorarchaeota archaeon]|nr:ATP-binding cassette domain-containing protein [Candidatus Thorarchaeota archaeon]